MIRSLITEEMSKNAATETPEGIRAKRLNAMNERLSAATFERSELLSQNKRHFKGHEERDVRGYHQDGTPYYYDSRYVLDNEDDPTPADKTGEIAKAQLTVLDAEIEKLNKDIDLMLHPCKEPKEDELPKEYIRYME
jgi:hypothetical protein